MTIYKRLLIQEFRQCKDLKTLKALCKVSYIYLMEGLI
jgi:hypothetical protein